MNLVNNISSAISAPIQRFSNWAWHDRLENTREKVLMTASTAFAMLSALCLTSDLLERSGESLRLRHLSDDILMLLEGAAIGVLGLTAIATGLVAYDCFGVEPLRVAVPVRPVIAREMMDIASDAIPPAA